MSDNSVPLKEHLEKTTDLRISAIERQLEDVISSRIKLTTTIAIISMIISALALILHIIQQ